MAAWESERDHSSVDGPPRFSTSGSVGEQRVAVGAGGGGRRGCGRMPLSRGERGRGGGQRGVGDKDFQGQVGRLRG